MNNEARELILYVRIQFSAQIVKLSDLKLLNSSTQMNDWNVR